jgi:UDP-N-acetylglucosamine:LPS N-acetylglucosamine transferase
MTGADTASGFISRRVARSQCGPIRICLVSSPGGHLAELEMLAADLETEELLLVTVKSPHSASVMPDVHRRYIRRIERNPVNLLLNTLQALFVLIAEKPDAVLSTGAGDALPLMFIASGLGIPVVFIESLARIHSLSLTGRLICRWANLTVVFWPPLRKAYPRAVLATPMIQPSANNKAVPSSPSIVVLTGTGPRGFNRLLQGIDLLIRDGKLPHSVFAQIGTSTYVPQTLEYERFLPHPRLLEIIRASDIVITHDGAGSIAESLRAGKPTVVVARSSKAGELTYRSDAGLARELAADGWITLVDNTSEIPDAIRNLGLRRPIKDREMGIDAREIMAGFLQSLIEQTAGAADRT